MGQIINTCSYFHRFNNLLAFFGDRKQTVAMLWYNTSAIGRIKNMVFGPKCKEVVAKSLSSKLKSKNLFVTIKFQQDPHISGPPISKSQGKKWKDAQAQSFQFAGQTRIKNIVTFFSQKLSTAPVSKRVSLNLFTKSHIISNKNNSTVQCRKSKLLWEELTNDPIVLDIVIDYETPKISFTKIKPSFKLELVHQGF